MFLLTLLTRSLLIKSVINKSRRIIFCDQLCCSVTKSCLTLCNPMDCGTPGFPSFTISQSLLNLILCHPLLLPSINYQMPINSIKDAAGFFFQLCICSLSKYFLSTYYVPGTVLDIRDTEINKRLHCSRGDRH